LRGFCRGATQNTAVRRGESSQTDFAIAVSPDGRTILYTQLDEAGSDLMRVENFR
jgi:hypothetical protein